MVLLKIATLAAVCAAAEPADDLNLLQTSIQREVESSKPVMLGCDVTGKLQFGVDVKDAMMLADPAKNKDRAPGKGKYAKALKKLDIKAVEKDLTDLMTANFDYWPNDADYNNYGPFFVRLAWHCSGPFRASDGKGGCSGGRLRFEPERSWPDNTNLDKARTLLAPIKKKYGDGLSWGDLYTAAGSIAIQSMGGPTKPFCFGRMDDKDGKKSEPLNEPCKDPDGKKLLNGRCVGPWGPTTVGLIYVNPEGPIDGNGNPQVEPSLSATDVQDSFGRMGMNAMEIVALIGGGHAFGKVHGACADKGPGDTPATALKTPGSCIWSGTCGGDGKGANTVTSGFEGPWTNNPTKWDNDFFKGLVEEKWEKHKGPGGHWQWQTANRTSTRKTNIRLTSDMALVHTPVYKAMVEMFAKDQDVLDNAFAHAWQQLTEAGGTWSAARKCQEIPTNQYGPKNWAAWFPRPASAALPVYVRHDKRVGNGGSGMLLTDASWPANGKSPGSCTKAFPDPSCIKEAARFCDNTPKCVSFSLSPKWNGGMYPQLHTDGLSGSKSNLDWTFFTKEKLSAGQDTLLLGAKLTAGAELKSATGYARLSMQASDGNLVLYSMGKAVWTSKTTGHPGAELHFQRNDGNLVLYDASSPVWSSGSHGGAVTLQLQDDCNLVMLDSNGASLWALGTTCGN